VPVQESGQNTVCDEPAQRQAWTEVAAQFRGDPDGVRCMQPIYNLTGQHPLLTCRAPSALISHDWPEQGFLKLIALIAEVKGPVSIQSTIVEHISVYCYCEV